MAAAKSCVADARSVLARSLAWQAVELPPPHNLVATHFNTPTTCQHCVGLLWGLFKQGLRCSACGFVCHEKCADIAVHPCSFHTPAVPAHDWHAKHFSKPTFCALCNNLLVGLGKQGVRCGVCGVCVHDACAANVGLGCRASHVTAEAARDAALPPLHHFVPGAMPSHLSACLVCGTDASSVACLSGYFCTGCQRAVHARCLAEMDPRALRSCLGGSLGAFKLPPSSVVVDSASGAARLRAHHDAAATPLLVLINSRSGGQQGAALLAQFRTLLNPHQVFDLADGGPAPGLAAFAAVPNFRILGCGGDGTIGWILSTLDAFVAGAGAGYRPPVGVLPLGTGNDFSRALGWGPGYAGARLDAVLQQCLAGIPQAFDRWRVTLQPHAGGEAASHAMHNYFSIGVDAKVALDFHTARNANPAAFSSRAKNKAWYAKFGMAAALHGCPLLGQHVRVRCDDGEPLALPDLEAIIVLNLPSYGGGSNLWGKAPPAPWSPVSSCDGRVEVVCVASSMHLGRIKVGVGSVTRLAQCRVVEIDLVPEACAYPVQVDGEPWLQPPARIRIEAFAQQACVLAHPTRAVAQDFDDEIADDGTPPDNGFTDDEAASADSAGAAPAGPAEPAAAIEA